MTSNNLPAVVSDKLHLPEELAKAINGVMEVNDFTINQDGTVFSLYAQVTSEMSADASRAIKPMEDMFLPASPDRVAKWLGIIGSICKAGSKTEDDIKNRIVILTETLSAPAFCLTHETAKAYVKKYKWFPEYPDLDEFFGEMYKRPRTSLAILKIIANAKHPEKFVRDSQEERDATCAKTQTMIDQWDEDHKSVAPKQFSNRPVREHFSPDDQAAMRREAGIK